jgi:spore maturation protein CgeB
VKLAIFGLSISSSWGNGHASQWRGLCRALVARGHDIVFFERDTPEHREHRDFVPLPGLSLHLYSDWSEALRPARTELAEASVAMVTSHCPDGIAASDLVLSSTARLKVFYDLDPPVTLGWQKAAERSRYIGPGGLRGFDLALSYTGGRALFELGAQLGARRVAPLYGGVDATLHRPVRPVPSYEGDLTYLGTYSADRRQSFETLFLKPAKSVPERRFVVAGGLYPPEFTAAGYARFLGHLPRAEHPAFFSSSLLTLNLTRLPLQRMGFCPSWRLFEAAACGTPILTDWWEGLTDFFEPGSEVLVARHSRDTLEALNLPRQELARIGRAARDRVLDEHTAEHRARELESVLDASLRPLTEAAGYRSGR